MQPNSGQNPNPNPSSNHQPDQNRLHFHHHCSHHPPFPHIHIPVFFCSHPNHHHQYHFHHPQLHATQLPYNSSLPVPFSQTFINQASQGPEINHATVSESELKLPPQELATSNILEDNEEEEEDMFVLTDEWAEFFAKSEARRQLAKKNKKKNRT